MSLVTMNNGVVETVEAEGTGAFSYYGTCSTAAGTAAKTVTCSGFKLKVGAHIFVNFTSTNTASDCTLNVNSTGAIAIFTNFSSTLYGDPTQPDLFNITPLTANEPVHFVYNGTHWILDRSHMTTQYTGGIIKQGDVNSIRFSQVLDGGLNAYYGYTTTANSTATKVVVCPEMTSLSDGDILYCVFRNTNTAKNIKLNVNSTGAYDVYGPSNTTTYPYNFFTSSFVYAFIYVALVERWYSCKAFRNIWNSTYTECSTAAGTVVKVNVESIYTRVFRRFTGSRVVLNLKTASTASNPTLNINATGAAAIYNRGTRLTGSAFKAGLYDLVFDGTYWQVMSMPT